MLARLSRQKASLSLPYTRQALPRPSRLLATAATATATRSSAEHQPYVPPPTSTDAPQATLQAFLSRPRAYTFLPTPLPDDRKSATNDFFYTDTLTQDQLAVIDVCLHNQYDVPRAKALFDKLRDTKAGDGVLTSKLYNCVLEAYLCEVSNCLQAKDGRKADPNAAKRWLREVAELWKCIAGKYDGVEASAASYAIMLLAWVRFNPDTGTEFVSELGEVILPDSTQLLSHLVHNGRSRSDADMASGKGFEGHISVTHVIGNRAFSSSSETLAAIMALTKSAVDLSLSSVVSELGQAESVGRYAADTFGTSQDGVPIPVVEDPLENIPEVTPVVNRRARLKDGEIVVDEPETPFNIASLRKYLAQLMLARRVLPEDALARQKLLEESVHMVAQERFKHESDTFEKLNESRDVNVAMQEKMKGKGLQRWMWEWHQALVIRVKQEVADIAAAEANSTKKSGIGELSPFLSLISPEKLSYITILELMRLQGSGGVTDGMKTTRALLGVGKAVEAQYMAEMKRRNGVGLAVAGHHPRVDGSTKYRDSLYSSRSYQDLYARRIVARKHSDDAEQWMSPWSSVVQIKVGSVLVNALMQEAKVMRTAIGKDGEYHEELQPAFFHGYEYIRGQKLGVIRLNSAVAERLAKDDLRETLHPRHLPMLVKPKPWLAWDNGGYLHSQSFAMRFKDSQEQESYLKQATIKGNVELVYAGLDVLGSTPWKVNQKIFDVVLHVWNSGERLGKLPPAEYDVPEPVKPAADDGDQSKRTVYLIRQKAWVQGRANNHSDRCNVNYKIEIARSFLGDTLYLPHNLDFRGRAYPIPPHLNHIGDDLSRGLLMFGEGRPLGTRGLRWLKIHFANLYGYDKGSFDERAKFTEDHIEDIFDSAVNPLEGKRFWTKGDDPWQCLAACFELHAALNSPDPLEYVSHLPVHQDGTCNGLQHYAALGGDHRGAQQVNLAVTDRPSDVYTFVANMAEKVLEKDAEKGDRLAIMLKGKIARKVVKQTVMTTVYGVTFIGARDQIEKQLRDRKEIPEEECWLAAAYLAKVTLACIGDLFSGAKGIQVWLNLAARLISKSIPGDRLIESLQMEKALPRSKPKPAKRRTTKEQMTSVVWTTPLGLPIVQPYRKTKRKQIATQMQTVFISDPNSPAEVNSTKQATAFPPNFIHSLDATHMMLTALECRTKGITFASVHDSYWTHASTIDDMSSVIRETFIALHSSGILEKLQEEFRERYKGFKIPVSSLRMGTFAKHLKDAGTKAQTIENVLKQDPLPDVDENALTLTWLSLLG